MSIEIFNAIDRIIKANAQVIVAAANSIIARVATDSATAFQVQNAAGTTTVLNVDTTDGRVGIGTTGPGAKLDIKQPSGSSTGGLKLTKSDSGNNWALYTGTDSQLKTAFNDVVKGFSIDASTGDFYLTGNVGIGTTGPGSYHTGANNLVISETGGWDGITIASDTNQGGAIYFADGTSGSTLYRGFIEYHHGGTHTDKMLIGTAGDYRVAIDSSGNVGIGTTTPAVKIHSAETSTITGTVADGYAAALMLSATYNAATAQTVTRHNYIRVPNVVVGGAGPAAVTNAAIFRFDAAAGTHKALAGTGGGVACTIGDGPTGANAGTPLGWMKINVNGTLRFIPFW